MFPPSYLLFWLMRVSSVCRYGIGFREAAWYSFSLFNFFYCFFCRNCINSMLFRPFFGLYKNPSPSKWLDEYIEFLFLRYFILSPCKLADEEEFRLIYGSFVFPILVGDSRYGRFSLIPWLSECLWAFSYDLNGLGIFLLRISSGSAWFERVLVSILFCCSCYSLIRSYILRLGLNFFVIPLSLRKFLRSRSFWPWLCFFVSG